MLLSNDDLAKLWLQRRGALPVRLQFLSTGVSATASASACAC